MRKSILLLVSTLVSVSSAVAIKVFSRYRANRAYVQTFNGNCNICRDVWTAVFQNPGGAFECTTMFGESVTARNGQTFFTSRDFDGACRGPITKVTISQ